MGRELSRAQATKSHLTLTAVEHVFTVPLKHHALVCRRWLSQRLSQMPRAVGLASGKDRNQDLLSPLLRPIPSSLNYKSRPKNTNSTGVKTDEQRIKKKKNRKINMRKEIMLFMGQR